MTPDDIITDIIRREGTRFTDLPLDRGGPTKFGITVATLQSWRKHPVTGDDVAALDQAEATAIYRDIFIHRPRFDAIADGRLQALAIDSGVLHGVGRAVMWLQRAAGCTADGILGPVSLEAINASDPTRLHASLLAFRVEFIGRLITRDPAQAEFAAGWLGSPSFFPPDGGRAYRSFFRRRPVRPGGIFLP